MWKVSEHLHLWRQTLVHVGKIGGRIWGKSMKRGHAWVSWKAGRTVSGERERWEDRGMMGVVGVT